ncbi:hypothetical protein IMSAG049_01605 [Clostridiales bacterium]|nr:hypothetical protein IMSAG049_01605 [Clostridiales bacterium]
MNDEKEIIPFYCKWPVIVIVTILLWPLGAVLVWKRGKYSRQTCLNTGMISMAFGAVMMGGAVIAGYLLGDAYLPVCAIYGICGAVFARMGYEAYKKANIYKKIIFEIENEGTLMVPMLADEVGMPEIDILKNLDAMFKKNLIPNYEMARNNKKLIKK